MIRIITKKRLEDLERNAKELEILTARAWEIAHWCAKASPEIGVAMLTLLGRNPNGLSNFRDGLIKEKYDFEYYSKMYKGE